MIYSERGYGHLLYKLAMQEYDGLIPTQDKKTISKDAIKAWNRLYNDKKVETTLLKRSKQTFPLNYEYRLKNKLNINKYTQNTDNFIDNNKVISSKNHLANEISRFVQRNILSM